MRVEPRRIDLLNQHNIDDEPAEEESWMPNVQEPSNASECPSCKAAMHPDAKFCQNCGAPADGLPAGTRRNWRDISLIIVAAAAVSFGLTFLAGKFATEKRDAQMPPPSSVTKPASPPDISKMTPRDAADRLFNRVMAADERGDTGEVMRFMPMALMAYERVAQMDADARYHVGLLNLLAGNPDAVRTQIEHLNRESPKHLLGLVLAFSLAEKTGDKKGQSDARARFAAAYDSEIMRRRPEYETHRPTILQFHAAAGGSKATEAPAPTQSRSQQGAQLFASKCASCHGPGASGSDKGPPLVHKIYEPSHHGDGSFYRAVRQGVKKHHWPFGDMPPVPGVTDAEIRQLVAYVRALQVKAGIR